MIQPRILGRVAAAEFLGRDAELRRLVRHAESTGDPPALMVSATPGAGSSELLRQAYDQLFARRGISVPIYLAFERSDSDANEIARRLFQTCLQQYIAYRRVDPSLCETGLTSADLLDLAPPGDYELLAGAIELFESEALSNNLLTPLLNLLRRFAAAHRTIFPLIDCGTLAPTQATLARALLSAIKAAGTPFVIAARRRQLNDLVHGFDNGDAGTESILHLDQLPVTDAEKLIEVLARRHGIETNEPTRDLLVQQLQASPKLISGLLASTRERGAMLDSFLAAERMYVDDLMGGRIKRSFDQSLRAIASGPQSRRSLLRLLYESAISETQKSSLWSWKKRLGFAGAEFERVVDELHFSEFINSSSAFIEANTHSQVWLDYLQVHYRLEIAGESRARVVTSTLLAALKRAPQTMAQRYRRETAVNVDELVSIFDCQKVPATLFYYDRFAELYRGEEEQLIERGLDTETDLIQLPQIAQTAACSAVSVNLGCEPERCVAAHGFAAGEYKDENEIVWLCAQIDAKLEASRELTERWFGRLAAFAEESRFARFQIWLIAPQGFSASASELLNERGAFSSSHQQFELLKSRLQFSSEAEGAADEFEMVIPMSADSELVAARTAEQIARRVKFQPEAINQIKTAVVEACINAAEHSLSPDRKIYQRFVVEDDKLVITVASRGVVPQLGSNGDAADQPNGNGRRGWGLKLIKTLMDEVEFKRVDDGTQLKMTKYRK
ncbi:MAG TPA: ATP-binding protein [Pyrinomonadaceae bacterium]|jgi:serine/threonine-protein kinase RsbW|nr:ATP-binding protein [Pyrinomonadaceae bacterium]